MTKQGMRYPQVMRTGSSKTSWHMLHLRWRLIRRGLKNSRGRDLLSKVELLCSIYYLRQDDAILNWPYLQKLMDVRRSSSRETIFAFYLFSTLAATSFAVATLTTLPLFDSLLATRLFHVLLKASAATLILSELAELVADPAPTPFAWVLCLVSMGGNFAYIWSASNYPSFNSGQGYILGEFLVSLAYELKILALILHQKTFKQLIRFQKRHFLRYVCIAGSSILFLTATVLYQLKVDRWVPGVVNLAAGVTFLLSIFLLVERKSYKGYEQFESSAASTVPRVV